MVLINNYIFKTLTISEVLLVSSVLCATDTVAAMSLIKPEKYPVLNAVLFGEGIINDAVAIILFRSVGRLNFGTENTFTFLPCISGSPHFSL
jgi:NhaP-type Na+/H+ or K+/H+ antiporter